jgi:hypothetical protein
MIKNAALAANLCLHSALSHYHGRMLYFETHPLALLRSG